MMLARSAHGSKVSPDRCSPDCANVVGHRRVVVEQVESTVGGIDRTRPDACPLPVDESAQPAADPQHVARVEVTMDDPTSEGGTGPWNSSTARSHSAGSLVQRGGS